MLRLSRKVQVLYKHLFYKEDSASASPYQKYIFVSLGFCQTCAKQAI
jgi:hypothetical protein